jgi:chromosome segregation protein
LLTAQTLEDLKEIKDRYRAFSVRLKQKEPKKKEEKKNDIQKEKIEELHKGISQSMEALERVLEKERVLTDEIALIEQQERHMQQTFAEKMKQRYEVQSQIKDCDAQLLLLTEQKNQLSLRKSYYDAELQESAFIFGPSFLHTLSSYTLSGPVMREDLRKSIEKLKIRLEEHSGIGNDVVKEYNETRERDTFLAREIRDIENSIANLESLVIDLKKTLDERFTSGVEIINAKFGDFFKTMFGGGSAFLSIVIEKRRKKRGEEEDVDDPELVEGSDEDDRFFERGIDVHVNLPSKKVKELQMLSGGERSLVSIALLFAISQVNPPPFLVLDETDAALDEANSRRYGDMVEKLSELSQLIVVTHNRETMSRAGVLYGVTLGADGGSKILSIKFDDAVKVAK